MTDRRLSIANYLALVISGLIIFNLLPYSAKAISLEKTSEITQFYEYLPFILSAYPAPDLPDCDPYFESVNPALIVKRSPNGGYDTAAGVGGVWSIILTKAKDWPISSIEGTNLAIFINGDPLISGNTLVEQLKSMGYIRLDYNSYNIPNSANLNIITEQDGQTLCSKQIHNIAQTGIFKIPRFKNLETGITNPDVLANYEIRVYHVDSMVLPDHHISSSFDIGDTIDVDDQCGKPDGIHPVFIHNNAIDFGKCESGPSSTYYEIQYTGVYPMKVKQINDSANGISITFDFVYELVDPPLFMIENNDGSLEKFFLVLQYCHLTSVILSEGEIIQSGAIIGLIGKLEYSTELEEARWLSKQEYGESLEATPFIPFKLTYSESEGMWIESLINNFNNSQ